MNVKRISKLFEEKPDLLIRQLILDTAQKKGHIIYGARATNVQLPTHLRGTTKDYDVMTKKPKKTSKEMVKELNRRFHTKDFTVERAWHKGTYKIKYKGKTVVDYTQLKRLPKTKKILGNKYVDIKSVKRTTQRLVKKPSAEFRRKKDMGTLERIQKLERIDKMF